jgi:hypothetical protein
MPDRRAGEEFDIKGLSRACVAGSINLIEDSLYINNKLTFLLVTLRISLDTKKIPRVACQRNLPALLSRCPQAGATGREDALGNEQANADILRRFSNYR